MENEFVTAYVSIGSNLGDRAGNLLLSVRGLIEASFQVTKLSAVYETAPVDIANSSPFLNMAAEIRVNGITPTQMLARMLRVEYLLGRTDKSLKKPRTIDLDLLFFGQEHVDTTFLTVPHPRAHLRRFVLVPMNEISPTYQHPLLHKDIGTLLAECDDTSAVVRWYPQARDPLLVSQSG
ncbi:MAG TPA: 2-amino-4-hydroxy-6-hydroxymethyldihydropteridine diphosphokinase [Pyrinomonadaceae bacterium]|nr:2-amino-4-hydroxy-6-hydroxymethyldihydropteridine diphosphokinase [Pyrinomonadaceae bacterium]